MTLSAESEKITPAQKRTGNQNLIILIFGLVNLSRISAFEKEETGNPQKDKAKNRQKPC